MAIPGGMSSGKHKILWPWGENSLRRSQAPGAREGRLDLRRANESPADTDGVPRRAAVRAPGALEAMADAAVRAPGALEAVMMDAGTELSRCRRSPQGVPIRIFWSSIAWLRRSEEHTSELQSHHDL